MFYMKKVRKKNRWMIVSRMIAYRSNKKTKHKRGESILGVELQIYKYVPEKKIEIKKNRNRIDNKRHTPRVSTKQPKLCTQKEAAITILLLL